MSLVEILHSGDKITIIPMSTLTGFGLEGKPDMPESVILYNGIYNNEGIINIADIQSLCQQFFSLLSPGQKNLLLFKKMVDGMAPFYTFTTEKGDVKYTLTKLSGVISGYMEIMIQTEKGGIQPYCGFEVDGNYPIKWRLPFFTFNPSFDINNKHSFWKNRY